MKGVELHTRRYGAEDGEPVVAVHGVKGHAGRWRWLADQLTDRRWHALDLRGHGHSDQAPPWSVDQHVADVLATMDSHRLAAADVFAHSFGALVAVHLARRAPHRVRRLVLLDPAIGLVPGVAGARAAAELHAPAFDDPEQAARARSRAWPGVSDPQVLAAELAAHLVEGDDGRWRWRYVPAAVVTAFSEMARPAVLPPTGVPVLLVRATRVQVVRPELVDAYRAAAVDLTVADLDCYHEVPLERPVEVAQLVRGRQ